MSWFRYERPNLTRITVAIAYVLASAGLLVLAFDGVLFDEWAIVGAASATLVLLALLVWTGHGSLWLGVGGAWLYATIIELVRGVSTNERTGLGLVFLALAFGALAAYTAYRREEPLRL